MLHRGRTITTVVLSLLVLTSLDGGATRRAVSTAEHWYAQRPGSASRATAGTTTVVTVTVPVTAPWTDTGIVLHAGDVVEIRAWGRATADSATVRSTPPRGSGRRGGGCTFVVTDAGVPSDGLVGNVAASVVLDGRGFFVGPSWKGSVPVSGTSTTDGRLLLGVNGDGVLCDRSGYDAWRFGVNRAGFFTAEIAITRHGER